MIDLEQEISKNYKLSTRTLNALSCAGIIEMEDLMSVEKEELQDIKNLGPVGIKELYATLNGGKVYTILSDSSEEETLEKVLLRRIAYLKKLVKCLESEKAKDEADYVALERKTYVARRSLVDFLIGSENEDTNIILSCLKMGRNIIETSDPKYSAKDYIDRGMEPNDLEDFESEVRDRISRIIKVVENKIESRKT